MNCPGLHCPGCSDGTSLIPAAVLAAGVWFAVTHEHTIGRVIDGLLITAGATVAVLLALTITGLVRVARRESLLRIGWSRPAIRADANPRQAIPGAATPMLTAEQMAGLAALGQAIHDTQAHGPARAPVDAPQRNMRRVQ